MPSGRYCNCQASPFPVSSGSRSSKIKPSNMQLLLEAQPSSTLLFPALKISSMPSYKSKDGGILSFPIDKPGPGGSTEQTIHTEFMR